MKPISKIDTIFKRDENFVVTDELKRPVFRTISTWVATEKVDGTSMRVGWARGDAVDEIPEQYRVEFDLGGHFTGFVMGKSNNASIPGPLRDHCVDIVADNAVAALNRMASFGLDSLTLYGEGYGGKIQSGSRYSKDQKFILFDVRAGDVYLSEALTTQYSEDFDVPRVPILGLYTFDGMVELAKRGFTSSISDDETLESEGLVGRTLEPLYDAHGSRLIVKLKTKDWAPSTPKPDRRP